MKKILILLSLVIVLTSCGAKGEPTVKEIDASAKKMMEEQVKPDTNVEKVEETNTETGTASEDTINSGTGAEEKTVTEDPIAEKPVKAEPKPVVKPTPPKQTVVTTPPVVVTTPPVVVTPPKTTITKDEVAKHNKKSDCYTIIDAKVYDITSFFGKHPGGDEKIIGLCGIDGSAKFNSVHGENEKANITKGKYFKANLGN